MKTLRNEKGFALLFVLILSAIALVMTLGMLFMVGRGSFVSGQQKRYRTAVEASRGGVEAMQQLINNRGIPDSAYMKDVNANLAMKIDNTTKTWGMTVDKSITITPNTNSTYDMKVDLGTYTVYTKIVDTVQGNTGPDEGLLNTGVVGEGPLGRGFPTFPYLYTIEVLAQNNGNVTERSKFSVLYQY